jgi:hypothetical protein
MWHDATGLHLRVTRTPGDRTVFRGFITSTSPLHAIEVRGETRDAVTRSSDLRTVRFRFSNVGGIDGLDLRVAGCSASLRIGIAAGGQRLPVDRIGLGADASDAPANPFSVARS